jgi:hypothetical protein
MGIHIAAEAACNHCGKREPCQLKVDLRGDVSIGSRSFSNVAVDVHDLHGWFAWNYLMACSVDCKEALSKAESYKGYGGSWTSLE